MADRTPLEIIDRFAKAVEAHPNALPFSAEEREAIARVAKFYRRLDALAWFFGWGKWVAGGLILIALNWTRITDAWAGWNGQ